MGNDTKKKPLDGIRKPQFNRRGLTERGRASRILKKVGREIVKKNTLQEKSKLKFFGQERSRDRRG